MSKEQGTERNARGLFQNAATIPCPSSGQEDLPASSP